MAHQINLLVLGATGVVGKAMIALILDRYPTINLVASASGSKHTQVIVKDKVLPVIAIDKIDFNYFDIVLSGLPAEVAQVILPKAISAGCFVVDNSSAFRAQSTVPLVVPEVNSEVISSTTNLVASPNCIAIPLSLVLKPLLEFNLESVNTATYQAVSGAGQAAIDELTTATKQSLANEPIINKVFQVPIAFNVLPYIDVIEPNGYSREELKIHAETRKILGVDVPLNVTAVRVPVINGHAQAVTCQFKQPVDLRAIHTVLAAMPGISLSQDYVTPATHSEGDQVWVSRIRHSLDNDCIISFWVVADNVLKGAALNAVQILECKLRLSELLEVN